MADPELERTIDREAGDDQERADSRLLLRALGERRGELGGAAALPVDDRPLSERILREARSRSEQIRRDRSGPGISGPLETAQRQVPWWLIGLWVAALAAVGAAWWLLG